MKVDAKVLEGMYRALVEQAYSPDVAIYEVLGRLGSGPLLRHLVHSEDWYIRNDRYADPLLRARLWDLVVSGGYCLREK